MAPKTAYITGGASGIGRAVALALAQRGMRVAIADRNLQGAQSVVDELNPPSDTSIALEVDVASWESQVAAFEKAVDLFERIDYVFPIAGIGERVFVPNDGGKGSGFVKPDLSVIDVDFVGFVYTVALAVQQMRRQEVDDSGLRGRIAGTASVCGFYCVPTLPIYTSAKHGVVGLVRSYGKYLPEEHITLNAICPHVLRTSISTSAFYDDLEASGRIVQLKDVVDAFESLLDSKSSGECLEVGPNGGFQIRSPPEILDAESLELNKLLYTRGLPLHQPKS